MPTKFDPGARALLVLPLKAANLEPEVKFDQPHIDARLLETRAGFILPLANYNERVGEPVTVALRVPGSIRKATSAYLGEVPVREENGRWVVMLKELGYGDVLRLDR